MNNRIKQLANEARNHAESAMHLTGWDFDAEYDKKFAELIIQDCIEIIKPCECGCEEHIELELNSAIETIEQHFGMK